MGASSLRTKRRVSQRSKQLAAEKALAAANALSNDAFVSEYLKPDEASWPRWTHPTTRQDYALSLRSPQDMAEAELAACFALVERTSGDDYRRAAAGWHPPAKQAEMRTPDLRYVLVRRRRPAAARAADSNGGGGGEEEGEIRGFASFMPTCDDHWAVVYCYEIHLQPELERTGLGALLMGHVTAAADRIGGLDKTMLTCFVSNAHARRFYERMGFVLDASSPGPRQLRDRVLEPDYVILSRPTTTTGGSVGEEDAAPDEGHQVKRARRIRGEQIKDSQE